MSLGDHLEELRARLIMALLGIAVGLAICLFFTKPLIKFLEKPYLEAVQSLEPTAQVPLRNDANSPAAFSTGKHLIFVFTVPALEKLGAEPGVVSIALSGDPNAAAVQGTQIAVTQLPGSGSANSLQALGVAEGFLTYIKVALIAGLVLSSPWVFYHLWMFISAGLYTEERKFVTTAVPLSATLFICGAIFFVVIVAPLSIGFLVKFNKAVLDVTSNFRFGDYISFVTMLMLVFGVAFQTPIAIYLLNRTGLVSTEALRRSRKFVVLIIFIVAAMATPPDVVSQVTLAIPLYMLFELGIILSDVSRRRREAAARSETGER